MRVFGLGILFVLLIALVIFVLLFLIGPFLLMLALNYVFYLLFFWRILGNLVVVTFWQAFWLIIAFIIIRTTLFGQHLGFLGKMYPERRR